MTVPVFTPTPVIAGTGNADMPAAIGTQIGATTDANFTNVSDWGDSLEPELQVRKYAGTAVANPSANFSVGAACTQFFRGELTTVYFYVTRTGGAALVSLANGAITSVPVCSLINTPPFPFYFPLRCYKGPIVNCVLAASGLLSIRGCSAKSYTFPTTWTVEGELMWIGE